MRIADYLGVTALGVVGLIVAFFLVASAAFIVRLIIPG